MISKHFAAPCCGTPSVVHQRAHKAVRASLPACRTAATTSETRNEKQQTSTTWDQFAINATGEWEGATASFNPQDGTPIPLDPYYVPQAFRDWDVELYDWQTTCSTLAKADEQGSLSNTCRCMMPTVGCEADAVAFTEEAQVTDGLLHTVAPDGSYVAGPMQLDTDDGRARVEFCLPLASDIQQQEQQNGNVEAQPRERVRIVHRLQVNWMTKQWELSRVELHKERYSGPYKGQVDLRGCGGGMPGFSRQEVVSEERAKGSEVWQLMDQWAYEADAQGKMQPSELPASRPLAATRESMAKILLPLGVVLHSQVGGDKGDVNLQVTVAVGETENRVAMCGYVEGELRKATMARQVEATR